VKVFRSYSLNFLAHIFVVFLNQSASILLIEKWLSLIPPFLMINRYEVIKEYIILILQEVFDISISQ